MNASFGAVTLESRIPQPSSTASGSRNSFNGYGQGSIAQESSQGHLPHHMTPDQGGQHAQEPQGRQLASCVSTRSPTPNRLSFDSLEQVPTSEDNRPQEASKARGQEISNICCRWFSNWAMEILSCAIASLCLAAIFGILYAHQGLPLPRWPLNIIINALIAVFTAIFKMSLLVPVANGVSQFKWLWFDRPRDLADIERLDQASRGAWGSFLLLISRLPRLDAIWLANLGAIISIAALAIDPFSQQIIQSESCLQNITGAVAEISMIQMFEAMPPSAWLPPLPGSLQAAIYTGLLSPAPNSSAAMNADCRTGNCTFPSDHGATFSTLAMCHSCVDISHTINNDNSPYGEPSVTGAVYHTVFISYASSSSLDHSLFSFEAFISRDPVNHTDIFAVACGMTPCLKTFGANVTNGVYQERELSSVDLVWSPNVFGFTIATNMTLRNGTWQSCMPTTQYTTVNTAQVDTTTMGIISVGNTSFESTTSSHASLWYPEHCVWWFGGAPASQMTEFLHSLFDNKTLVLSPRSPNPVFIIGDLWLVKLHHNGTANMDTVGAFLDGLAWSVTAAIRQISTSDYDSLTLGTVSGQAQLIQTCLTVRWVWLSLPASLLGLQLAFLVAIVVISGSAEHWRGNWKDSSLALLYHGLNGSAKAPDTKVEREELCDKDGMFKVARATKVQLRQGKDNWRFHTVP